jgi:AcrR family transcriptional regulator
VLLYVIVTHITPPSGTPSKTDLESAAPTTPSRRDRVRNATLAEIKQLAWSQIASEGAASLSLRAIARDMGMTSSALYRYFSSRDELLVALSMEGFTSLADHLEAAETRVVDAGLSTGERFLEIMASYRRWAVEHPTEYALTFGTPVPGFDPHPLELKAEMFRGINVLFRCMMAGLESGEVNPAPLTDPQAKALRVELLEWGRQVGMRLGPEALAACMLVWTQLHGAISLEVYGHMPAPLTPADALFEHQMREVLRSIGCEVPAGPMRRAAKSRS